MIEIMDLMVKERRNNVKKKYLDHVLYEVYMKNFSGILSYQFSSSKYEKELFEYMVCKEGFIYNNESIVLMDDYFFMPKKGWNNCSCEIISLCREFNELMKIRLHGEQASDEEMEMFNATSQA